MIGRLARHLFSRSASRVFPADTLERIAQAVARGEATHTGETCFAVESALPLRAVFAGVQARDRAVDAFSRLRVWDTAANNGVLLYLLLADHRIEIVADRGLQGRVSDAQWRGVCQLMEERLRAGDPEAAAVQGIEAAARLIAGHFPRTGDTADENELPDLPHVS
jgi:uncharacterized membrane protein